MDPHCTAKAHSVGRGQVGARLEIRQSLYPCGLKDTEMTQKALDSAKKGPYPVPQALKGSALVHLCPYPFPPGMSMFTSGAHVPLLDHSPGAWDPLLKHSQAHFQGLPITLHLIHPLKDGPGHLRADPQAHRAAVCREDCSIHTVCIRTLEDTEFEGATLLALKEEKETISQRCGQPLEVGKGKKPDSPPELCQPLDFSPVRPKVGRESRWVADWGQGDRTFHLAVT
ncbi:hypothetical protein Cadr_000010891 [Camelus dromedarius]|uniref:Uncharacterized protein n=1 Tax=Camelus dromedarius TaxID=9838 RepID=A0A5N4DQG1_CAMDR|nr:hypothetical protein Cadr_000010891 [Camelus dromedarius]